MLHRDPPLTIGLSESVSQMGLRPAAGPSHGFQTTSEALPTHPHNPTHQRSIAVPTTRSFDTLERERGGDVPASHSRSHKSPSASSYGTAFAARKE